MFSRRKPPVPGKIDTLIARSTVLQGDLAFAGGLHLDGRVVGRLSATPDAAAATLWIGEAGCVEGGVEARHVVIHGTIKGDVHGTERVVLGATARITGDVHYGAIEMTLGRPGRWQVGADQPVVGSGCRRRSVAERARRGGAARHF